MNKIITHIPHASLNGIFDPQIGKWQKNAFFVNDEVMQLTDLYVDMLFATERTNVTPIVFNHSRFVCDVERLIDDPMEKEGQGIIYTHYKGYKRGELSTDAKDVLMGIWGLHQQRLINEIDSDRPTIILDCHSFSGKATDSDICIGYNNDDTYNGALVGEIASILESRNYSVSFNKPYSNSIAPKTDKLYKSVMIEVNKRVYMASGYKTLCYDPKQWTRWYGTTARLFDSLSDINL